MEENIIKKKNEKVINSSDIIIFISLNIIELSNLNIRASKSNEIFIKDLIAGQRYQTL